MKAEQLPSSLVYVTDEMPGYHRIKMGQGFIYKNERGRTLKGKRTLKRIEKLTFPPMWEKVWISRDPNGHIQATGRDEKGRKQYIYHPRWKKYIGTKKYDKLIDFAKLLPIIRRRINRDLKQADWSKEKVAALAIMLMDKLFLRIGNKYDEEENGTYGTTTLRKNI
jgi:DNA topoisomerase-1